MPAVSVQNLSMSFGDKTLFEDVSFEIEKKDKIGFIGANGVGKTTLLRLLQGELIPSGGTIATEKGLVVGYMEQHACSDPEADIYHELLSVFTPLQQTEKEIDELNRSIDLNPTNLDKLVERQTRLIEDFERNGGLTYKSRTRAALLGLGFREEELGLPVSALSGGQRSKLSLAKLLLSNPGLLLLDEPTNHLDIESVAWLEDFLRDFSGAILLISHDRYFLDRVTNKTIELEHGRSMSFKGAYSEFVKKKEAILEAQRRKYENDMKEIRRIEGIIKQQRQWNREKNIVTAESKQKEIDRIKAGLVRPESDLDTMRLTFEPKLESGNDVLMCQNLSKSFGSKRLFQNAAIHLRKGERVFILGANGCGKTTLFRIIMGMLPPDTGDVTYGVGVMTGYFDQLQQDLNLGNTAFDEISDAFPQMSGTQIRSALARFLFKGDEVFKPLLNMSGGERARISLLKLMLHGSNLLLLDEPTNHLDAASREELERTLAEYTGTLLIISHDRYFINKLATRVLVLSESGVSEFLGNYDYYLEKVKNMPQTASQDFSENKKKSAQRMGAQKAAGERGTQASDQAQTNRRGDRIGRGAD